MNELVARVGARLLFAFFVALVGVPLACDSLTQRGSGSGGGASDDDGQGDASAGSLAPELRADGRPVGWSEETHSNDGGANYAVVFPEGKVNRLDITIAPEDWQAMQDDMTEMYGEFGVGGPPAAGGDQGPFPPGGPGGVDGELAPPEGMGAMPDELVEACEGLEDGDSCTSDFASGTCTVFGAGQLVCLPEVGNGDRPEGGLEGGGLFGSDRNPIYVPCAVEFDGQVWWYVGIRFKGQSSLSSTWSAGIGKLPLRLDFDEFENEHSEIDNQRFYGFKELSLANNWSDRSFLREKVAHDVFREAGVPAPRTTFYRIYVDFGEGATYFGLYTMTELPDEPMLEAQFGDAGGNLYKPTSNWVSFNQEDFDKETNQEEEDWSDVEAAIAALHADGSAPEAWRSGLEAVFNVDGFLRWLAVNTVIQNWDTYGNMAQNYYLYGDPADDGRLVWVPWDNNMALSANGGMGGGQGLGEFEDLEGLEDLQDRGGLGGGALSLALDEVGDNWPLIRYLADDPVYWGVYVSYVQETIEGAFAVEPTQARFQAEHDLIAPYVIGVEGEQPGYTVLSGPEEFAQGLEELLTHVAERRAAVLEFLQTTP